MGLTSAPRWKSFARAGNALGALAMVLALSGCGGGGDGSASGPTVVSPSPTPTPTPTSSTCSLSARQDWAKSVLSEWYLFPNLIDNNVRKSDYTDLQSYIDALVAPAREQNKDRGFTYLTSIEEEEEYYSSGSTAGFGMLLAFDDENRLRVKEAFENAPAYAAGMDRGTEIIAAGRTDGSLKDISEMTNTELLDAFYAGDGGKRVFKFVTSSYVSGESATYTRTVTPADYELQPLSPRYGFNVNQTSAGKIGYVHLRTFIEPAEDKLRDVFGRFKAAGVSHVIIDVRYNGGGLIDTAAKFADLFNKGRDGEVWSTLELRESKPQYNDTYYFADEPNAIDAIKVAFIGTGSSASASEMMMNGQIPWSGENVALIGGNTFGKPVGQFAFDLEDCDDRLRVVTFRTVNAEGNADYFDGIASAMPNACSSRDNLDYPLGGKLDFMKNDAAVWVISGWCAPLVTGTQSTRSVALRRVPVPERPTIAQIEIPGLF